MTATLKLDTIQHPSSATPNITLDTAGNATVGNTLAMGSSFLRNRIINGDMRIDQRNAGASVSNPSGYLIDRFYLFNTQNSKLSFQQNQGAVTPPAGFTTYAGFTSSSAYSAISTDLFDFCQPIEGLNIADLGWGSANAQSVTLSFWVRSSLTGTFGGAILNSAQNYNYPFSYSISSANTWEKKTITISGPTSGTWLTTNGIGIGLNFSISAGSNWLGTAGAWTTTNYHGVTGQVNLVGTSGATFYITGVQLEVGSVATPFERRLYSQELALAQRYYYRLPNGTRNMVAGFSRSTTVFRATIYFAVPMRANISAVEQNGTATDYEVVQGASDIACSSVVTFQTGTNLMCTVNATVASGLTAGWAGYLGAAAANTAYLAWSAEL